MKHLSSFRQRRTWYAPRGLFHWVNALCILCLLLLGFVFMYRETFGFVGIDSKIALKRVHTYIGFIFVANLVMRALAGLFVKHAVSRPQSMSALLAYVRHIIRPERPGPPRLRPASQLLVVCVFVLMSLSAVTGLLRASTDLYLPPLGALVAHWIVEPGADADQLDPRSKEYVNEARLHLLNQIKIPIGFVHKWSAYLLVVLILVHIRMASDHTARKQEPESAT